MDMIFDKTKLDSYLKDFQGYKLDKIHFRIGSKYHTDTFIHARVLLQNSFYTSRIALLLVEKIIKLCKDNALSTITLVGYERYSELLLGIVTNYLNSLESNLTVSSCIMVDTGETMDLVLKSGELYENFITIVPIVSTGSTSRRISHAYQSIKSGSKSLRFYHVFQLSPSSYSIPESDSLYKVSVNWFEPYNCDICYGNHSLPLLEADKTNLNPILIFGYPGRKKVYHIDDPEVQKIMAEEEAQPEKKKTKFSFYGCDFHKAVFDHSLQYLSDNKLKDFRAFSHLSDVFISENRVGIEYWLDSLQSKLGIRGTDKIFILSPCHVMTNMAFINLVNNRLFNSSATIFYLEPDKEYAENFKRVYQGFLNMASGDDVKIFYVDDDLVSGKTFFSIYDLFRFSAGYGPTVLTGSLFLMNKATPSVNERVMRASGYIYSYVSINLPHQYLVSEQAPFSREILRYEQLMKRCLYYEPEIEFREKRLSLKQFQNRDSKSTTHSDRHLDMFYATHVLYDIFSDNKSQSVLENETFDELIDTCKEKEDRIHDKYAVMKVLSSDPFTMYRPIRDKIFEWTKNELNEQLKKIKKCCDEDSWKDIDSLLGKYLFLLHRSVLLGNLQIVSIGHLSVLASFFNKVQDDGSILSDTVLKIHIPEGVLDKILKRYVELISSYPASAVPLKKSLCSSDCYFSQKKGSLFKERLLDETSVVAENLFLYMQNLGFKEECIWQNDRLIQMSDFESIITEWFSRPDIKESTRYKIVSEVFGFNQSSIPKGLIYYFWEKCFISCDLKSILPNDPEEKKTVRLCSNLKTMMSPNEAIGAFFVVADLSGEYRLVYDEDKNGYSVLNNRFKEKEIEKFFTETGRNLKEDSRILIRIEDEAQSHPVLDALHCKVLHVYRIGDARNSSVSGIMGFYTSETSHMNQYSRRFMLLLRRDILRFIDFHHRSEEFIQSVLAEERRKFAYLTGHGRDVMLRLSWKDDIFKTILVDMERLQRIFAGSESKSTSILELLNQYFEPKRIGHEDSSSLVRDLEEMMKKIYDSDIVEISEKANYLVTKVEGEGSISFSERLLKYICFELLVNAKKNRFQKSKSAYSKVYYKEESPFVNNDIGIALSFNTNSLFLSVSGTGPKVDPKVEMKIKKNTQIKERGDISGLDLIINLIKKFNSENQIDIKSVATGKKDVMLNTVQVHLLSK